MVGLAPHTSAWRRNADLEKGSDLVNGTMTVQTAQTLCNQLADCIGITFSVESWVSPDTKVPFQQRTYQMYLKGADEWSADSKHRTLVKQRPKCADAVFLRYRRASHGPYCCKGTCPEEHMYAVTEIGCTLPASTPFGLPNCDALRGQPLSNIAVSATATVSSQWRFAENAGIASAHDGVVDTGRYFHSDCPAGGPQWFRLAWPQPVAVHQVVLHNRVTFRARLVGAKVTLRSASGETLTTVVVTSARTTYVWTLRPTAQRVSSVEIRLPTRVRGARTTAATRPGRAALLVTR